MSNVYSRYQKAPAPARDARSPISSNFAVRKKSPPPFASKDKNGRRNLERRPPHRLRDPQRHCQKSNLNDFKNIRKGGIIAIKIEEGDKLIDCKLTDGHNEIVLITHEGMSIRFSEEEVKDQGRDTVGVWGIRPDKGDYIVGAAIVNKDAQLLVAGENGLGKRTSFEEYRLQGRGGKGIITMKTNDKTGAVAGALTVETMTSLCSSRTREKWSARAFPKSAKPAAMLKA